MLRPTLLQPLRPWRVPSPIIHSSSFFFLLLPSSSFLPAVVEMLLIGMRRQEERKSDQTGDSWEAKGERQKDERPRQGARAQKVGMLLKGRDVREREEGCR